MTATIDDLVVRLEQTIDRTDAAVWAHTDGAGCDSHSSTGTVLDLQGWGRCSRQAHDPGTLHVACASNRVVGFWRSEVPERPEPGVSLEEQLEDAKAPPLEVQPGLFVRFKNRVGLMAVVGERKTPASTGTVEVVDLESHRFRVVDKAKLALPKEGKGPTPDQLVWLFKYMAERRNAVRTTAQNEAHYFKGNEFNAVMKELSLEGANTNPMKGILEIRIGIEGPQGTRSRDATGVFRRVIARADLPEGWKFQEGYRVESYGWT